MFYKTSIKLRHRAVLLATLIGTPISLPAYAQTAQAGAKPGTAPTSATPPQDVGNGPQSAAVPTPADDPAAVPATAAINRPATTPADFARIDALTEPGLAIVYPGMYDSILQDRGGWRSTLADAGVSLTVRNTSIVAYDLLQNNRPAKPQAYNGQKLTLQTAGTFFSLAVSLDRFGLGDTKLLGSGIYYATSWAPDGPTKLGIRQLALYHSFANKAVEVKVGYQPNYIEFIGVLTGGSPLLTTGLSSLVPVQVGLSADPVGAPTFNLTLNGKNGLYFKGGVQRSASPLGQIYEVRNNGIGLDFGAKRARALYIAEFGVKRAAAAGQPQVWLRTGALYNTSDYTRYVDGKYSDNWSLFALGDYQVKQVDPQAPYRGVYFGASVFYAPPAVNVYSQYYEARAYTVGLFDARPADSITLNINYSRFSPAARANLLTQLVETPRDQFQVSTSYSTHVARGVYVSPSLAYVKNPGFAGRYRDALNAGLNLFLQF